ncbi:DUF58 domain-containing protein [Azospirillum halopraeferens]|uniref:DUF58 domain-containing protein n=1 Tax=Azospirillum halopraeferens TaxID=34010 RepID=UPI000416892E|nr:DUF58 domain-containing protein [Azospirillum halopraeferens]
MMAAEPIPYRLRWRPAGERAGAHPGSGEGGEGAFRRHVPLLRHPDPRRVDVRETARNPMGEVMVRRYSRRAAITVAAAVDLSGSMGFAGRVDRMAVVSELCATLAASAGRMGDRFCLIGCDSTVREDLFLPPTHRRGVEAEVYDRLMTAQPRGAGTDGLALVAGRLPAQRCLVVLISDFLLPMERIVAVMDGLWRHDVLPVVLHDRGEDEDLPAFGLVTLRDAETGRRRLTLMRPALRAEWSRRAAARRGALDRLFLARGRAPFHLVDGLDRDALAGHLLAG